jgi:hypothetical protein
MIRIEAENALKMTEQEMLDVVFEASENSVVELNCMASIEADYAAEALLAAYIAAVREEAK